MARYLFIFLCMLSTYTFADYRRPTTIGEPEEPYAVEPCSECKCCHAPGQHKPK
ncbi:MAG: hypothetical protein SNF33_08055 [Candidatus Algichlamydia australiensis]|nr:hypothetical protein [Chlamydiales bacterium]